MKKMQFILVSLILLLLGQVKSVMADDIDIYSTLGAATDIPNVLIIIDNAANFDADLTGTCSYTDAPSIPVKMAGKLAGLEQCALNNVIHALPTNADGTARVNVGMMVYGATGIASAFPSAECASSNNGGCLISPLAAMTATNKATLMALIKSWEIGNIKANGEGTALAMQEAWAYYAGSTGASGRSYAGIKPAFGCQKNYVIFLGNAYNNVGTPGDGGSVSPSALLTTAGATSAQTATISIPYPHGAACNASNPYYSMPNHTDSSGLYADEWARFMHSADLYGDLTGTQDITTYTVAALGSACKADYPALLTSMARSGGGKYFAASADSSSDIVQAFLKILNEVQAVNSVFSAASLPVSVNAQGTYLNQIYMGMFRPDEGGDPRWLGNMKQYQFLATRNSLTGLVELQLGDSLGASAISAGDTGFISPNAVSYWTCGGNPSVRACSPADPVNGFWANDPNGVGLAYDLPDGQLVEKGGAAQMMRLANLTSTSERNLKTSCLGSGCALSDFNEDNEDITDTLLGTGPRTISSIVPAETVSLGVSVSPGASGAPNTISITTFSKVGSTVTATVSAGDAALLSAGTSLKIATSASKYNCDPCTVLTVGATSFTYAKSGGGGTPSVPYIATIYSSSATVTKNSHGLSVGQTVTMSNCSLHGALNGNVYSIASSTTNTFTLALVNALETVGADTNCRYTPNTATATLTTSHDYASGESVTISGSTESSYNGTWSVTPTGDTSFSFQYTDDAPQGTGTGGTVSSNSVTRSALINWVRGEDNYGDEASLCPPGSTAGADGCPNPMVTVRPSLHGDVLHSRPLAINYGGSTGVVVYYGGNDGVYRAVNGNQDASIGSTPAGGELWGFIPSEHLGKLKRLNTTSPELLLPSTPSGIVPTPKKKDYFADGATGVYQTLNADGTTNTAYIYVSMRRGGEFLYALNVTDPANPRLLWKLDSSITGFGEIGQTWSAPKIAKVKGHSNPVLIFGAGYSTTQDAEPATTDTKGRGIYIVDAITGVLVKKFTAADVAGMVYSIPADITLFDSDNDRYIDRLYAADVGGNIWRVDLQPQGNAVNNTPSFWQVTHVASLGGGVSPLRKFFFPPDVVPTSAYDAVIAGTGDREHPLSSTGTLDRVYVLKDLRGNDGSGATTITEASLFDASSTVYDNSGRGYFKTFAVGEKVVNAPISVAGYTYYATNRPTPPAAGSCTANLGEAVGYRLNFLTGETTSVVYLGGGLAPSAVAGVVMVTPSGESSPTPVPFCIGCGGTPGCSGPDCTSALGGAKPEINVPTSRTRTYWYQEID